MKQTIGKLAAYFAFLILISCNNSTEMTTVIKDDGSCYKEFSALANKQFLMGDTTANNPFIIDIDSACEISWKHKDSEVFTCFPAPIKTIDSLVAVYKVKEKKTDENKQESEQFIVQVRKNYNSVEELKKNFKFKKTHHWSDLKINYELERKFRWFFTYYTYRETYPKIETDFDVPFSKYMSNEEVQFWFNNSDKLTQGMNGIEIRELSGSVEDKYNMWFANNAWNYYFKILLANYDQLKNPPVTKQRLELLNDTIFNKIENDKLEQKMDEVLNKYFKTTTFTAFWKDGSLMKAAEERFENQKVFEYVNDKFNYNLILPGKIIQSHNATVKGDTMTWRLTAYRMIPTEYIIEAQSRKANVWAFILTGLILIVAIGSFFWKPKTS